MRLPSPGRLLRGLRRRPVPPQPPAAQPPGEAERLLRRLDFTVVRRLDGLRQGEHRNAAFGFGLDLGELRPYQVGDDVRALDWNVTARMGEAYVRRYHEDRDVTAWLLIDLTASTDFGSAQQSKRDLILDIAGTLARLLTARGDRVGALLYTGSTVRRTLGEGERGEERGLATSRGGRDRQPGGPLSRRMGLVGRPAGPERRSAEMVTTGGGRVHVLQLLRRALDAARRVPAPGGRQPVVGPLGTEIGYTGTHLASLLEQGFRTAHGRSLVVVLSDFLDEDWTPMQGSMPLHPLSAPAPGARAAAGPPRLGRWDASAAAESLPAWERALGPLARRHEVVGVWVRDAREVEMPDAGVVTFQDAESGEQLVVDTSQPSFRAAFAGLAAAREAEMERRFARHGATLWKVSTAEPIVTALVHYLEQRRRTLVGARRLLRQTA